MADLDQIEQAVADRVGAVNASAHAFGDVSTLRESTIPLAAVQDAAQLGHLRYSVALATAPRDGTSRDGRGADGAVYVRATVVIAWAYRLRGDRQTADQRRAASLASDIARAVCAQPTEAELDVGVDLEVEWVDGYRPALDGSGEWLLVEQTFNVRFNLALEE